MSYLVTWSMVVDGPDPGDAAQNALAILRDVESESTVFQVDRVVATLPSDGRPYSFEALGNFDGKTGEQL
jgi:hypothetical protein